LVFISATGEYGSFFGRSYFGRHRSKALLSLGLEKLKDRYAGASLSASSPIKPVHNSRFLYINRKFFRDWNPIIMFGGGVDQTKGRLISMDKKYGLLVICSVILLTCFVGSVYARTWYVDDGTANFTRIQDAVDNATAGDTIIVSDGTYVENVDVYVDNVIISSVNGSDLTIVQATNSSDHVFEVSADYVNISGFTVMGATGKDMAGIDLFKSDDCNISNNNLVDNEAGIRLSFSSNNRVANNTASNNGDRGIFLYSSSNNTLTGNTASNDSNGIYLSGSSNNNLKSNIVNSNTYNGIYLQNSRNNTLMGNTANLNNDYGIHLQSMINDNTLMDNIVNSNRCGIRLYSACNNTLTGNTANSNKQYGIWLRFSSNNIIYLNNFVNNTYNIKSYESANNTLNSKDELSYNLSGTLHTNYLGNYWSDYEVNYPDAQEIDLAGIWNTPYEIDGGRDKYPLMEPFENYILA
jgi:parallel beta-helix repeat protein